MRASHRSLSLTQPRGGDAWKEQRNARAGWVWLCPGCSIARETRPGNSFISDWKEIRLPLCRGIYLLARISARHEHWGRKSMARAWCLLLGLVWAQGGRQAGSRHACVQSEESFTVSLPTRKVLDDRSASRVGLRHKEVAGESGWKQAVLKSLQIEAGSFYGV